MPSSRFSRCHLATPSSLYTTNYHQIHSYMYVTTQPTAISFLACITGKRMQYSSWCTAFRYFKWLDKSHSWYWTIYQTRGIDNVQR